MAFRLYSLLKGYWALWVRAESWSGHNCKESEAHPHIPTLTAMRMSACIGRLCWKSIHTSYIGEVHEVKVGCGGGGGMGATDGGGGGKGEVVAVLRPPSAWNLILDGGAVWADRYRTPFNFVPSTDFHATTCLVCGSPNIILASSS